MTLRLGARVGLPYGVVVAALALVLAATLIGFESARRASALVREELTPGLERVSSLLVLLQEMETSEYQYAGPEALRVQAYAAFDRQAAEFVRLSAHFPGARQVPGVEAQRMALRQSFRSYLALDDRMRRLLASKQKLAAQQLNLEQGLLQAEELIGAARHLRARYIERLLRAQIEEDRTQRRAELVAWLAAVVGVAVATALSWRSAVDLVGPLRELEAATRQAEEGRLVRTSHPAARQTVELARLQEGFNAMVERIEEAASRLRSANDDLERTVAERTQDLAASNHALRASIIQLRSLDRLKTDFMAVVAHELQTPLTGLITHTEALVEGTWGELAPEQHQAAVTLLEGARRLGRLIRNVLEYARMVYGELVFWPEPVDVAALIGDLAALFSLEAARRGVQLEVEPPSQSPVIDADATRLGQALFELIDNAVKFTGAGGHVRLRLESFVDGVAIEVADSGVGIAPELVPQLFRGYFQADSSSTRKFGGLGLGLTIAHQLITRMGGTLEVSSELGQGTTFRVWLPAHPPGPP